MIRRWNHWRQGRRDFTPILTICAFGFGLSVAAMGLGELLLALSS